MTEGLADAWLRATPALERLYRTWSEGGAGLLITGNVQVDRFDLERPGNVAIDLTEPRTFDAEARARLAAGPGRAPSTATSSGCRCRMRAARRRATSRAVRWRLPRCNSTCWATTRGRGP